MNIALVHDWITNLAGAERVLLSLKEIFPEADIYTSVYNAAKVKEFLKFDIKTTYLQRYQIFRDRRELLIPYAPLAFESLDLSKYDIVITSTTYAAKGVITKPDTVHICYCHTPTRYLWDPQIDDRATTGKFSAIRKKVSHKLRIWDFAAAQRPDHYIANSKTVKERIKKYYKRDSEVIYPAVDIQKFFISQENKPRDYYLFVSRLVKYKKADVVIKAFNSLKKELVVIGDGPEKDILHKIAQKNIMFLGKVDDSDLLKYYQEAKAFVFAAEEDFGIVPIEAMACGKPVIAYAKGGAAETVINGKTGLYFYHQTEEDIVEAVKNFETMKLNPIEIRQQAEKFSKEVFIDKFKKFVENTIPKTINK